MTTHPKNVIVSGTPGAWGNVCAKLLLQQGWSVLWKDQDVDIINGRAYLANNCQNVEVYNIHLSVESKHDISQFSSDLPTYYDIPYPGPAEYIAKFEGQPAVISGTCLAPLLDMWQECSDIVIDIRATLQEDIAALRSQSRHPYSDEQLQSIREHQLDKYNNHLKLFAKVFTITNAEVKDQRFDTLSRFLNSVF
tara:strand:- start:140 stop:721 length:582 start_codon:yes stop_codon:yes gene_type:complete